MFTRASLLLVFSLLSTLVVVISGKGCESNPCKNGGVCTDNSSGFTCACPPEFVGLQCTLSPPEITCGKKAIEVWINEKIVEEMNLSLDEENVYFNNAPGCRAVRAADHFHLRIDAPFLDCGLMLESDADNFIFSQKVVWNRQDGAVERPVVLLDFKCFYSGKYNVSFDAIKPTVTTVDFDTTYGEFTLQMDLFKTRMFDGGEKFSTRPIVTIDEEVCIKNVINGGLPDSLVLTALQCWASDDESGISRSNYELITNRCAADTSKSYLVNNGDSDDAKFCFNVFKWKDSIKAVFIHCKVHVCNTTSTECICEANSRAKRYAKINEETEVNSAQISSPKIQIVEKEFLTNWLDFLESEADEMNKEYQMEYYEDESYRDEESNKSTVLVAVGVILVLIIVGLGILVGVVVSYNKKNKSRNSKSNEKMYGVFT